VLRRILDALLDCAVVSFALWTLLYCLGLATQWSLFPSGWLWLVATLALVIWQVVSVWRTQYALDEGGEGPPATPVTPRRVAPPALLVAGLVATVVAAMGGVVWTTGTFRFTWLATVAATACLLLWSYLHGRHEPQVPDEWTRVKEEHGSAWDDLVVLGVMAVSVVASLFVHLADTDDPYYLNRSVWVAERGNAARLDTMFTPEVLNSPYGGGVPIASIESLLGVIAHMTGLRAGTVTYLVATPVFTALSVWAIWRLVRRWAPRRAVWVLVVAIAFLMLSGDSMLGNFWIVRMWQGKVMAVTFLMPLIWAYLTEVHDAGRVGDRRLRTRTQVLLLASGVAFFGFTPTAVVWGPVMLGVVVLAAAAVRSRTLLVGGALMVIGPIVSGLAVIAFSTGVGGEDPTPLSARASFVRVLGEAPLMVALALVALAVSPLLARRGAAAVLAGGSALVGVLVYAPGVLDLINAVTGSGPILWRMLYVAPVPVLVGLLVALPWAERDRPRGGVVEDERPAKLQRAGALAGLAAVVVGFVGGNPVWAHTGHGGPVTVSDRPEWKLDLEALADVEVLAERDISGTVLLPPRWMKVLTMYTTEAFPVVPREWFIQNMDEPRASTEARRLLFNVAGGEGPFPSEGNVRRALEQLDVTLACVGESQDAERVVELYEAAGFRDTEKVGSLTCLRAPSGSAS
jgi:Family of unknown function (DUF6077)